MKKLVKLELNENVLSREELMKLRGGASLDYTTKTSTGCKQTGSNPNHNDCTDGDSHD